jgi:calpain-7
MVEEKGTGTYTLVVSQYEKNETIHYTLRVYSTCEFKMFKVSEPYDAKLEKQVTGKWSGKTAGGCANYLDTHQNNPIYQLKINNNRSDNMIQIELKGPKQYSVGFSVVTVSENIPNAPGAFKKKTSGDFRRGFCVLELENVPGGVYNISPCTFSQHQEGPFFLNVSSSVAVTLTHIQ